ncbi:uncharacterized protein LOC110815035 [Carica papaya]|uniref:uncharacterized protein LOC110815035 n=1 Tax=Carica papaya TaxID=3649 RepID=UPI000B8CA61B|nr:uncharacterized protein LOC110815035 [Carica papaya]XP_021898358.1 uncharacterized protein LOC110815035 [Carica papaya]
MLKRGAKSKAWRGAQNYKVAASVTSLVLVLLVLFLLFRDDDRKSNPSFGLPNQKWNSFQPLVQFHPSVESRNGTDLIWQVPGSPKAVLFLAHGCNGRAANFWDRSARCPICVGLPEERLLVLHALARNFAVLTISSAGRCWTLGKERLLVKNTIRWWVERQKLEALPLVALGASSGGYFVSSLANELRFSSIALMVSAGAFDEIAIPKDYPPTLFVHMPKDLYRRRKISEYMDVFRKKGIDVAEIECLEFPLFPTFFAERIPGLDQSVSTKLFELFREKDFIDEKGYMKNDGRITRWKEALRELKITFPNKNLFHPVQEELNLAFAYHEMTSLQSEQIFKWFESHMS